MKISVEQLQEMEQRAHGHRVNSDRKLLEMFVACWDKYAGPIGNTHISGSHFIAQVATETDHFKTIKEYHDGSDYEGSKVLGNIMPGDGKRFPGRGYLMITGRDNYTWIGRELSLRLDTNPSLLEDPEVAFQAAVVYWRERVQSLPSVFSNHKEDVARITSAVQGSSVMAVLNGAAHFEDRLKHFMACGVVWPHTQQALEEIGDEDVSALVKRIEKLTGFRVLLVKDV